MDTINIAVPGDAHVHVRDGSLLADVLHFTARQFGWAIIMPNLKPPVTTLAAAHAYEGRITQELAHFDAPWAKRFVPLMTLYLTDNTNPGVIVSGVVHAVKYYPAGATTNSDHGVTDLKKCYRVFERMEREGMPLLLHGEVVDSDVDIFDRERVFIDRELVRLVDRFPKLKIVLEHVTTKDGVDFVTDAPQNIAATITAHHLLENRNAIFRKGINPHHYCLPVLKREEHRRALVSAAISGNPKFFLGTDTAPHPRHTKETSCGCAGIFTAHAALELYAEAFDQAGALDKIEGFASHFGADFYGLARSTETVTLKRRGWLVPDVFLLSKNLGNLIPFRAGEPLHWKLMP